IVCSTDDERIARRAAALGIETDARPAGLAADETPVADVARDFLRRATALGNGPDWLVLLQPTSPFLQRRHLELLAAAIEESADANSAQTIVPVPHNHHAWNQRLFAAGRVSFAMPQQRAEGYNKQRKP